MADNWREKAGKSRLRIFLAPATRLVPAASFVRLAAADPPPLEIVALLQKEMAARLAAEPRTKDYGALTVNLRLLYEVRVLRAVPPGVFHPPPEVDSVLVRLRHAPAPGAAELHALAVEVARLSFGQRRKKMAGLLAARFGVEAVAAAFGRVGLAAGVRAEEVPVAGFAALAEFFRLRGADARPPASPDTGSRRGHVYSNSDVQIAGVAGASSKARAPARQRLTALARG